MDKKLIMGLLALAIIGFAGSVIAENGNETVEPIPGTWWGWAFIDGNAANLSAVVTSHINGSDSINSMTNTGEINGSDANYYLIQVPGAPLQLVNFKLCGIWANNKADYNWSAGGLYPDESSHSPLNLSVNAISICENRTCPDEYKCAYDCACVAGDDNESHCVHNFCRETEPWVGDGFCDPGENCQNSADCACPSGYWYCYSGECIYNPPRRGGGGGGGGATGSAIASTVCGDGECEKLETYESCPKDCPKPIVCGDGDCEGNETYETCLKDCPVVCGDGVCEGDETYETCLEDCPKPIVCGDGVCEGNETYETCLEDCPKPIVCGDGACGGDETCRTCASDCGTCPVVCGDGICEGDEKCDTCSKDCGVCPNLAISCTSEVTAGDTVTCHVTDGNGNSVDLADVTITMPDGTKKELKTDGNGNTRFTADQSGTIAASAGKKEYLNAEMKIPVKAKGMPLWYLIVPLVIILLLLLLLLMRKKKTVAEPEFIMKAIAEGKLSTVLDKLKKIYVTPNTYREYKKVAGSAVDERIEEVELSDKGNEYLDEVKNETVALAMQLKAKIVLTTSLSCKKTAEGKGFKALNVEEAVE